MLKGANEEYVPPIVTRRNGIIVRLLWDPGHSR